MIRCTILLAIIVAAVSATGAANIVTSKDSLWIYNNSRSGRWTDSITIKNTGIQGVRLDSIRLRITEWNTLNPSINITDAEVRIGVVHDGVSKMHSADIDSAGTADYRLNFFPGLPAGDSLFGIGPSGDSVILTNVQMGYCFSCGLEQYPRYLSGTFLLHFSNSQVVGIRIYSDDLRPTGNHSFPAMHQAPAGRRTTSYLINGRMVPDRPVSGRHTNSVHQIIYWW